MTEQTNRMLDIMRKSNRNPENELIYISKNYTGIMIDYEITKAFIKFTLNIPIPEVKHKYLKLSGGW